MAEATAASLIRCVTDIGMRILDASAGMAEMLHIPESALIGRDVLALTYVDDRRLNRDKLDALEGADQPFAITKRYVRDDQTLIWVRNHVSRGPNDSGKPTLVATIEMLPKAPTRITAGDLAIAEQVLKVRRIRSTSFGDCFANEPTLDMMLVLFAREKRGLKSTVGTMCSASEIPYTTAHRRFNELVESGLATTAFDPVDKRLVVVCLTPTGRSRVEAFLRSVQGLS